LSRQGRDQNQREPLPPRELAGELAVLRPLRAVDRKKSVQWRNDPEIRDNVLGYRFPVTEEMEANWVQAVLKDQSRTRLILAIEDRIDGMLVGFVYLNNIDWFARNAELGILIGERSRHGKGLGKDALALVTDYAFETLNLNKLYLRVVAFNRRALRLYRSFGFIEEGIQREQTFSGGRCHNVVLMGLLRREFKRGPMHRSGAFRPRRHVCRRPRVG
jgi:RimJ/RimL family protein N-acetyltransferase